MKRYFICLLAVILALVLYNSLWATCPEDTTDLGICDTLYVEPWAYTDTCIIYNYPYADPPHTDTICINDSGEKFPCFLYVNILVTHDSNTFEYSGQPGRWQQDSIKTFTIFLGWTRTNTTAYCSLSTYWNENVLGKYDDVYPRSMYRHFPKLGCVSSSSQNPDSCPGTNRLEWLADKSNAWAFLNVTMSSDSEEIGGEWLPSHIFMTLVNLDKRDWWEGSKTLLATLTFRVEDAMTICIDSLSYAADHCGFVRYDAQFIYPRDYMPLGIRVNGDGTVDTCQCPGTDVRWIDGSTEENKPTTFNLSQNYPNPFNPVTNFKFSLPQASHVKIEIFNILGQNVKTLVDEDMRAGSFVVDWDGKDQRGVEVSSGIYFYRIIAGDFSSVKRMVLLK
jgi:hypothetical protein